MYFDNILWLIPFLRKNGLQGVRLKTLELYDFYFLNSILVPVIFGGTDIPAFYFLPLLL